MCNLLLDPVFVTFSVSCPAIPGVANARSVGTSTAIGAQVRYTCNSCFIGGGAITCLANGAWSQLPSCTGK